MTFVRNFFNDEQGQDLIEYSLLLAFVALASALLFTSTGSSISQIWTKASGQVADAASKANAAGGGGN